jgi:hypothetical protein
MTDEKREATAPKQNSPLRHWRFPIEKPNLEGGHPMAFFIKNIYLR